MLPRAGPETHDYGSEAIFLLTFRSLMVLGYTFAMHQLILPFVLLVLVSLKVVNGLFIAIVLNSEILTAGCAANSAGQNCTCEPGFRGERCLFGPMASFAVFSSFRVYS